MKKALSLYLIALAINIMAIVLLAWNYADIPQEFVTHRTPSGQPDGWAEKSILSVFSPVVFSIALIVGCSTLLYASYIVRKPQRVRAGGVHMEWSETMATRAQNIIDSANMLIAFVAMLVSIPIGLIALSVTPTFDSLVFYTSWIFTFGILILLIVMIGFLVLVYQSNRRLEADAAEAKREKLLHKGYDSTHRDMGLNYHNPGDPHVVVTVGPSTVTFNTAHDAGKTVWLLLAGGLVLLVGTALVIGFN